MLATWSMTALSAGSDDIVAQSDMTLEETSGVTEEKQIGDLFMQMEKCKSPICISPMSHESSSGGTKKLINFMVMERCIYKFWN